MWLINSSPCLGFSGKYRWTDTGFDVVCFKIVFLSKFSLMLYIAHRFVEFSYPMVLWLRVKRLAFLFLLLDHRMVTNPLRAVSLSPAQGATTSPAWATDRVTTATPRCPGATPCSPSRRRHPTLRPGQSASYRIPRQAWPHTVHCKTSGRVPMALPGSQ